MSTARSKPPSAAIRRIGSGCTNGGNHGKSEVQSPKTKVEGRGSKAANGGTTVEGCDHESAIRNPQSAIATHPGARCELAGRRGDDHAGAAPAARAVSRSAHRAARARKAERPLASSPGDKRDNHVRRGRRFVLG